MRSLLALTLIVALAGPALAEQPREANAACGEELRAALALIAHLEKLRRLGEHDQAREIAKRDALIERLRAALQAKEAKGKPEARSAPETPPAPGQAQ